MAIYRLSHTGAQLDGLFDGKADKAGFAVSGNPAAAAGVMNDAIAALALHGKTTQAGSGDPAPENVRAISGVGQANYKLILTGGENWSQLTNKALYCYGNYVPKALNNNQYCNAARHITSQDGNGFYVQANKNTLVFGAEFGANYTVDSWKAYLAARYAAGTPVIIWYQATTAYDVATTYYAVAEIEDADGYHATAVELGSPLFDGETADLVSGAVHRECGYVVLDGTESGWYFDYRPEDNTDTYFGFRLVGCAKGAKNTIDDKCTHLKCGYATSSGYYPNTFRCSSDGNLYVRVEISGVTNLETWKAYLAAQYAAGTPVTILYELAEPVDTSVTPPAVHNAAGAVTLAAENTMDVRFAGAANTAQVERLQAQIDEIKTAMAALGTV